MVSRINWDRVIEFVGRVITLAALLALLGVTAAAFKHGDTVAALHNLVVLVVALWVVDHFRLRGKCRDLRRAWVCRLCGALVAVGGRDQHDRWHAQRAQ